MGQITFTDLLSQETKRDPVAFSARLREQGPLIHLTGLFGMGEAWIVSTYDDAIAILKDPRFTKDIQKVSPPQDRQDTAGERASVIQRFLTWRRDMLTVDPPDHSRLRSLVSQGVSQIIQEPVARRLQCELGLQTQAKEQVVAVDQIKHQKKSRFWMTFP